MEVQSIPRPHEEAGGRGEFENDDPAAGAGDPDHLAEAGRRVGDVADAERDGHRIERVVREG